MPYTCCCRLLSAWRAPRRHVGLRAAELLESSGQAVTLYGGAPYRPAHLLRELLRPCRQVLRGAVGLLRRRVEVASPCCSLTSIQNLAQRLLRALANAAAPALCVTAQIAGDMDGMDDQVVGGRPLPKECSWGQGTC
jgi:hypothetical protein